LEARRGTIGAEATGEGRARRTPRVHHLPIQQECTQSQPKPGTPDLAVRAPARPHRILRRPHHRTICHPMGPLHKPWIERINRTGYRPHPSTPPNHQNQPPTGTARTLSRFCQPNPDAAPFLLGLHSIRPVQQAETHRQGDRSAERAGDQAPRKRGGGPAPNPHQTGGAPTNHRTRRGRNSETRYAKGMAER